MRAAEMEKEKVVYLLKLFPQIDEEIKIRKSIMHELEQYYNPMSAICYDDRNCQALIRTEKKAIDVPDFVRDEIKHCQKEIGNLQKVKVEILKEVSRLSLKHKKVIFSFYFNGMKWDEIAERTNYSNRQCKNIRDEALEKLVHFFSKNIVLSEYKK